MDGWLTRCSRCRGGLPESGQAEGRCYQNSIGGLQVCCHVLPRALQEAALKRGLGPDGWPAEGPRMPPHPPAGYLQGPYRRGLPGTRKGRRPGSSVTEVGTSEASGMSASAACSLGSPAGGPEQRCTPASCDAPTGGAATTPSSSSCLAGHSGEMEPALERCKHPQSPPLPHACIGTVAS